MLQFRSSALLIGFVAFAFLGPIKAMAACVGLRSFNLARGESIRLIYEDPDLEDVVAEAIEEWARCPNYGASFPTFVVDGEATRTIRVQSSRSSSMRSVCGTFRGDQIHLYLWTFLKGNEYVGCRPLAQVLAHELGHVLGLRDAPTASRCSEAIMARATPHGDKQVSEQECQAAGYRWLTHKERGASGPAAEAGAG